MAVLFWYLFKGDASVRNCSVHWTSQVLQGTRNTRLWRTLTRYKVQGDQLYIAMLFWHLVKLDLSSVRVYSSVHWRSVHAHVYLVGLYAVDQGNPD